MRALEIFPIFFKYNFFDIFHINIKYFLMKNPYSMTSKKQGSKFFCIKNGDFLKN